MTDSEASSESSEFCADRRSKLSHRETFVHRKMIETLMLKAETYDRDLMHDVFRLIIIYLTKGTNNLDRIKYEWIGIPAEKDRFIIMVDVYDIKIFARHIEFHPTLSRISEAFPEITLVLSDHIFKANPYNGLRLRVVDNDLGAKVKYHFKLNHFPGLLDVVSVKAQVGLLLHNLCQAKAIINLTGRKNTISAFVTSCKSSSSIMEQRLASAESRSRFTEYVESLPLNAELLNCVWNSVIGDVPIMRSKATDVTNFHKKVLNAQPLNLTKWRDLMTEDNAQSV